MKRAYCALLAACACSCLILLPARADYVEIPLDELVRQSDLIVVGKITAIEHAEPSRTATDRATITIEDVLLGKADKTVVLGFPGKRVWITDDGRELGFEASNWIRYKTGQEGIWLLTWDDEAKLYRAAHPARLQPKDKLDEVKDAIAGVEKEPEPPAPPTNEERAMIEFWLKEEGLNTYGDPDGTMYIGGTPLFDEATGKQKDRFMYIVEKHEGLLKTLHGRYAPKGPVPPPVEPELQERIDHWLRTHDLNIYGDKKGTTYPNWSPLFDEQRKVLRDRYHYVLDKLPQMRTDLGL